MLRKLPANDYGKGLGALLRIAEEHSRNATDKTRRPRMAELRPMLRNLPASNYDDTTLGGLAYVVACAYRWLTGTSARDARTVAWVYMPKYAPPRGGPKHLHLDESFDLDHLPSQWQ
jgi:hypothetical protein